jgi:hypothetical protein
MRYIFLALLLLLVCTLTACSFSTDFVIVNASNSPIEVRYKIGETGINALDVAGRPATLAVSKLSSREWQELSSTQYAFDQGARTVTVSLMPDTALRVTRVRDWSESSTMPSFIIQEVNIIAASGEIILKGDQVYKSFVAPPRSFFSFGPPASATLTYK